MIRKTILIILVLLNISFTPKTENRKRIEVVFCLELSGSTNGLPEEIRDNLWHFINSVKKENPALDLRIGLIGFSHPLSSGKNDFVSVLSDLSDHYDFISHQLYTLTATGEKDDQLIGSALYTAINEMSWTQDGKTEKIILLFGNGRVDGGRYDFRKVCDMAVLKDIIVYPVYSSRLSVNTNDLPAWNTIAEITGGEFETMRLTTGIPYKLSSSKAEQLLALNNELNDTYVHYTREGVLRYHEMIEADTNSTRMNEQFFYSRCRYKISDHYQSVCNEWDLVSQVKSNEGILTEIKSRLLPDKLKKASPGELAGALKIKAQKRERILFEIKTLMDEIQVDSSAVNPVAGIFNSSLKKHY